MATKMEIVWNHQGFEEILKSPGTASAVESAMKSIQNRANANNHRGGKGFGAGKRITRAYGSNRWLGFVYTTDIKSAKAESEDKALTRAVGGGG